MASWRPRSPTATPAPATPTLHTHVAVANKVQTRQGKWLTIFGKVLHELVVAASETYNTALERRLTEAVALAQQANLETREAKHEPRSYADQRTSWRAEAVGVLGSESAVARIVSAALHARHRAQQQVSTAWVRAAASRVVGELEARRATWQIWHVRAEAQRQVREVAAPAHRPAEVVEWVVDDVLGRLSVNLSPDLDPVSEPAGLRRSNGESFYRHTGADHHTSQRILDAERRIVATADGSEGFAWSADDVELSVHAARLDGVELNRGQEALIAAMATSGARVLLALAPAGSGKATAMLVLAEATGMPCETLAKLDHDLTHSPSTALSPPSARARWS